MNVTPLTTDRRALVTPAATAWGFIRHELLFLSFALLETALLTPLVLIGLGWARYWPAGLVLLWLLLVMLLPLNIIRLMTLLRVPLRRQQRVLTVTLAVLVLLSWRVLLYSPNGLLDFSWLRQFAASLAESGNLIWARDLSVFVVIVFVWWRGIRLAVRQPELNNAGLRLRLGGLIVAPLIIWFSYSFLTVSIVPFVLLFFLAALSVVTLVRAENIEQEQRGTSSTLNARWFAIVAGAAALIVLAGGVGAALLSGNSLPILLMWLSPLWHALQFGGTVVGVILFELTYPLFRVLAVVMAHVGELLVQALSGVATGLRQAGLLGELPTAPELQQTPAATGAAGELAGKTATGLIMLGLILLVGLALARVYQQANVAARTTSPSRATSDADEPGPGRRLLERLGLLRGWRAAASIRRIYQLMCRAAAAAGYPRMEAQTPYEYLPTLAQVWPDHLPEARVITESFIRIRYGEFPESGAELEAIRAAWRRLEAAEPRQHDGARDIPTLTRRE